MNPQHNPGAAGTKPTDFARDLARAVAGLEGIAAVDPGGLEPVHVVFGTMSLAD